MFFFHCLSHALHLDLKVVNHIWVSFQHDQTLLSHQKLYISGYILDIYSLLLKKIQEFSLIFMPHKMAWFKQILLPLTISHSEGDSALIDIWANLSGKEHSKLIIW